MKFSKEVKTGLLAVFAIATFIFGYNYLKGTNLLNKERIYYVVYTNVEGLDLSSVVTVNGLKIGKVQHITISSRTGELVVRFNVVGDFQFSKTSIAKIYGGGIIGGKSLSIIPDFTSSDVAISGDTLIGQREEGIMEFMNDRLSPLQDKIENTVVSTDSVLSAVADVLDKDVRESLKKTLKDLGEVAASFKESSKTLETILKTNQDKFNQTFDNLNKTSENFAILSDSLSQLEVGKLVANIENTIADFNAITTKLNNGEGSLGKLLNDELLYKNLEGSTKQLEQLLEDMKLNPKRYVHFSLFGKKPGSYQEPKQPKD
ncbi:MAG: MCE family protein [Bacteroidetes bacterium HGW-Bacteroidetes-2]|nr:MAG: MCE family protein [Bacteroidetes bacterium HGW-Bacteroidetes-2]